MVAINSNFHLHFRNSNKKEMVGVQMHLTLKMTFAPQQLHIEEPPVALLRFTMITIITMMMMMMMMMVVATT